MILSTEYASSRWFRALRSTYRNVRRVRSGALCWSTSFGNSTHSMLTQEWMACSFSQGVEESVP